MDKILEKTYYNGEKIGLVPDAIKILQENLVYAVFNVGQALLNPTVSAVSIAGGLFLGRSPNDTQQLLNSDI